MITDEMVEKAAQAVFEHWQFQAYRDNVGTPATVSWTPNGNSLKQDQARDYARAALEAVAPAIRAAALEEAATVAAGFPVGDHTAVMIERDEYKRRIAAAIRAMAKETT